jgi:hypothetical protein
MGNYSKIQWTLLFLSLISFNAFGDDPVEVQTRTTALQMVLDQSSAMENSGFCTSLPAGVVTPDELTSVLEQISQVEPPPPEEVRNLIIQQTKPLIHGTQDIDLPSPIYLMTQELGVSFSNLEKPSWFSGGNDKNYRVPKNKGVGTYFEELFIKITESAIPWNPTVLSRSDLFHGHLIYHRKLKDLLIVFHAKEYPRENPSLGSGFSMRRLFDLFNLHLSAQVKTQPPTDSYLRRNFLISLRQRKLCGVNTRNRAFAPLAQNQGDGSTLDSVKASDLGKLGEIMNINFFASEGSPLFFDILKPVE